MGKQFSFGIIADHITCQRCSESSVGAIFVQVKNLQPNMTDVLQIMDLVVNTQLKSTDAIIILITTNQQWKMGRLQS